LELPTQVIPTTTTDIGETTVSVQLEPTGCTIYFQLISVVNLYMLTKLLRPLAGYTLHDHKTNNSVRLELQAERILDKIDEYRRNWLLHLQSMPLNRIPLKSYHYRPQGRRTIGRSKKCWREQL